MKHVARTISLLSLLSILAAVGLFSAGQIAEGALRTALFIATVAWFGSAPFWMGTKG